MFTDGIHSMKTMRAAKYRMVARIGSLCLLSFALAWLAASLQAAPAPLRKAKETQGELILRLVNKLSDKDSEVRQTAYGRLSRIGRPALPIVNRTRTGKGEGWQLIARFCREMQEKYGPQPLKFDGLELLAEGDRVWNIPAPGGSTPVRFQVRATNVCDRAVSVLRYGFLSAHMVSASGESIRPGYGNHGLALNYAIPLPSFVGYKFEFRGELVSDQKDNYRLSLSDGSGVCAVFRNLKEGDNYLFFQAYGSEPQEDDWFRRLKQLPHPRWIGHAETCYLCIKIQ